MSIRRHDIARGAVKTEHFPTNEIQIEVPVPLGYIPQGQSLSSTGVKYESKQYVVSAELLKHAKAVYFETDLQQLSAGAVDIELYDYTATTIRATISRSATTKRTRSTNILASLVIGNPVGVRFNVKTAGGGTDVGGGCSPVLIVVLGVS
jgi:aminopeptidase C